MDKDDEVEKVLEKKSSAAARKMLQKGRSQEMKGEALEPGLKKRNDTYLIYLFALICFIILTVLFYYKKVLNKPIPVFSSTAWAQGPNLGKKKA